METKFFLSEKLSDSKKASVINTCIALGISPSWLMAVIHFETAGSLSPAQKNHIGSVGLIQFTRDKAGVEYKTIGGKRYLLADLAKMSFEQQMKVVYEYLKPYSGKIKTFTDLYLTVFFPVAIGKADDYVFQTSRLSASLIAKQNSVFDANKDLKLTKAEVTGYFKRRYSADWAKIQEPSPFKPQKSLADIFITVVIPATLFFLLLLLFNPLKYIYHAKYN